MAKKNLEENVSELLSNSVTFNPLMNALRENDKKNLFKSNVVTYFHKTGYPLFDYYFGSVVNVHNDLGEIIKQEPMIGQASGSFNLVLAQSGAGKTTAVVQISANIIRPYKSATIHHYDCEQRFDVSRGENISRLPISDFDDGGRYILKSGMVTLDTMQEAITDLYAKKMRMRDEITINTGRVNEFGKEIQVLEPTVIIVDSITTVLSESFSFNDTKELAKAGELRKNTEGARDAKTLKGFLKDVIPLCKEANIIIYAINHINGNMSMNVFTGPTKQQNFMKQDEAIPGGKTLIFSSFNIVKMIAKTSDDFTEETDGFNGFVVTFEPVKSSSNQSGNTSKGVSFEMVFSYKDGFDSLRSLILYAREKGIIEGNKPRMKFKEDPSFTFSFKNIHEEKKEKPIWDCIKKYIIPELESHLSFVEPNKFDDRQLDY